MIAHWKKAACLLVLFISFAAISPTWAAQSPWAFDQRQIVLVKKDGSTFPEDRIVAQLMDAFVRLGRVKWVTQKAAPSQIVPVEVPQDFPWQSAPSVRQLGLRYVADGVMVLSKKGVQVTLERYGTVDGQPLFFETVSLPDATKPDDLETRRKRLLEWVEEIWAKIPGVGYATKRDVSTVTIEGVEQVGLEVGFEVEFRRLDKMERHPLLKTLVGISSSVTGKGTVKEISKTFATVEITYESQLDPIQSGDRYAIINKKLAAAGSPAAGSPAATDTAKPAAKVTKVDNEGRTFISLFGEGAAPEPSAAPGTEANQPKYRVVDLTGFVGFGRVSHQETSDDGGAARSAGAYAPTFGVNALAYITQEVVLSTDLAFSLVTFRSLPIDYNVGSLSSGLSSFRFGAGYRFLFAKDSPADGEIVAGLGYRRLSLSLSQAPVGFAPTAKIYSGIDVGLTLILPIDDRFSAQFGGTKVISATLAESPKTSGTKPNNSVWNFEAGGRYSINPSNEITAGFRFDSASTTFGAAGARAIKALSTVVQATTFTAGYTIKY